VYGLLSATYQQNNGDVEHESAETVEEKGEQANVVDVIHGDLGNLPDQGNNSVHDSADRSEVVDRDKRVHLEVGGVQDQPGTGADRDRQRVGDRVVDRHELQPERAELDDVALLDLVLHRLPEPVLAQLAGDQRQGQLGADQRDVLPLPQQVRHRTDVVLVAVGEDDSLDGVQAVPDRFEVGEDQVDAGLMVVGEQDAAVDDEQSAVVLEDGHVATDLAQSTERDHPQPSLRELGGR
jgi:hypothetical protein